MVFPRRTALLALACALTPGLTAQASAAGTSTAGYVVPCLKADGETTVFAAKPKRCIVPDETAQERALVPVTALRWTTWAAKRAKATGKVSGDGYSGKVIVTATKPKRCSARRVIFTVVTVSVKLDGGLGRIAELKTACPTT